MSRMLDKTSVSVGQPSLLSLMNATLAKSRAGRQKYKTGPMGNSMMMRNCVRPSEPVCLDSGKWTRSKDRADGRPRRGKEKQLFAIIWVSWHWKASGMAFDMKTVKGTNGMLCQRSANGFWFERTWISRLMMRNKWGSCVDHPGAFWSFSSV